MLASGRRTYSRNNHLKKLLEYHAVYNQNGYDTRSRDRHSTRGQINKSDDAIMWLYTSCKPHKNSVLDNSNIFDFAIFHWNICSSF